jgi:hypothetical protein
MNRKAKEPPVRVLLLTDKREECCVDSDEQTDLASQRPPIDKNVR